jgi:hypothetical protein
VYILPEDGHRSGPKHVVVVHNKIENEKHLLRTVVLIKVLEETQPFSEAVKGDTESFILTNPSTELSQRYMVHGHSSKPSLSITASSTDGMY